MCSRRTLVIFALILLIAGLVYLDVRRLTTPAVPDQLAYFYNVETRKLFTASDKLLPPIDTKSGPATGVRAFVFTCGNSKNQSGRFIAYLQKFTPEGRQAALEELKTDKSPLALGFVMDKQQDAILVRRPQDKTWYPKFSSQGVDVVKLGEESGGCAHPVECLP